MKTFMRKIISLFLVCSCILSVAACGGYNSNSLGGSSPSTACTHSYTSEITKEATCGKNGIKNFTCRLCGDSYSEEIMKTNNHTFTSDITKESSCAETGVKTHTCIICGDSYMEDIKKTDDHDYKSIVVKEATDNIPGTRKYTCSICRDSYEQQFLLSKVNCVGTIAKKPLKNGLGLSDGYLACTLESVSINQNNEITQLCFKIESHTNITNFGTDNAPVFHPSIKCYECGKWVATSAFRVPSYIKSMETIYVTKNVKNPPITLSEGCSYTASVVFLDYA